MTTDSEIGEVVARVKQRQLAVCENCGGQGYTDMGQSACAECFGAGVMTPELRRRLMDLDDEAANLDGMAESSRVIASKHIALGDEVVAAFWRGRARGLQLAAHNLHLSPTMPLTDEEARQP